MLAVTTSLYDLLQRLAELGPPARTVQRAFRSHTGRSLLALSRHEVGAQQKEGREVVELKESGFFFGVFRASGGKRSKGTERCEVHCVC